MNIDAVALNRALDSAFSVSSSNTGWSEVVRALKVLLGADAACFAAFDLHAHTLLEFVEIDHDAKASSAYANHYHRLDTVAQTMSALNAGSWASSSFLPKNKWRAQEFYSDFLRPFGIEQSYGLVVRSDGHMMAALGFQSGEDNGMLSETLADHRIQNLSRLLVSAFQQRKIRSDLKQQRQLALLNSDRNALVEVSVDADVQTEASSVPEWLARGKHWKTVGRKLTLVDQADNDRFRRLLRQAQAEGSIHSISLKGGWGEVYLLRAWRTPSSLGAQGFAIALRIEYKDIFTAPTERSLRSVFDLTEAEARLLRQLMLGHELSTCADILVVSKNTVRKQLASIMRKTGCNRQSEVVRLGSLL